MRGTERLANAIDADRYRAADLFPSWPHFQQSVVLLKMDRLVAHRQKLRMGQRQRGQQFRRGKQLPQAELNSIEVSGAQGQRSLHSAVHCFWRVRAVQFQNGDEFTDTAAVGLVLTQCAEQTFVVCRPMLTPLSDGDGMLKGARALFEQTQIMEWIQDVLLPLKTTRMFTHHLSQTQDFHSKRIGTQRQLFAHILSRD